MDRFPTATDIHVSKSTAPRSLWGSGTTEGIATCIGSVHVWAAIDVAIAATMTRRPCFAATTIVTGRDAMKNEWLAITHDIASGTHVDMMDAGGGRLPQGIVTFAENMNAGESIAGLEDTWVCTVIGIHVSSKIVAWRPGRMTDATTTRNAMCPDVWRVSSFRGTQGMRDARGVSISIYTMLLRYSIPRC